MKIHPHPVSHIRAPLLAASTLLALLHSAPALTVPVAQDTHSLPTSKVAPTTGRAVNLAVNAKQTALLRFNVLDLNSIPEAIHPGNIKSVKLRLFVTSAKLPADILVRAVATNWQETFTGAPVDLPALIPGVLSAIPKQQLVAKTFVQVDITESFKELLTIGNDFGFALQTVDPKAKVTFGSKEGAATGYAAELEIVADSAISSAQVAQFDARLKVGGAFEIENSPNSVTSYNFFAGARAGIANTTGINNMFAGTDAGLRNTTGQLNTFLGASTGQLNISGEGNTFVGGLAGFNNTASNNVFVGASAGQSNSTGSGNVYVGWAAGRFNDTGTQNCFVGSAAGKATTSSSNSFFGFSAGNANTSGTQNAFFGTNSGLVSTGDFNAFFGSASGQANITGTRNVAVGKSAGINNSTGSNNTFVGTFAGAGSTTASNNTFIGDAAGAFPASVNNSTAIGQGAIVAMSNAVVLGNNCSVGIKTSTPNSTLQVNGSLSLPVRTSNDVLTGLDEDDYVLINTATSAGILLPSATGIPGRIYIVKNRAINAVTIGTNTAGQTIDGAANLSVGVGGSAHLISNGSNWFRIN